MYLYHIEFQIKSNGQVFTCKVVGNSQDDAVQDVVKQVGEIRIFNFYHVSEVHRITADIKKQIVKDSLSTWSRKKIGIPKKYELIGE